MFKYLIFSRPIYQSISIIYLETNDLNYAKEYLRTKLNGFIWDKDNKSIIN